MSHSRKDKKLRFDQTLSVNATHISQISDSKKDVPISSPVIDVPNERTSDDTVSTSLEKFLKEKSLEELREFSEGVEWLNKEFKKYNKEAKKKEVEFSKTIDIHNNASIFLTKGTDSYYQPFGMLMESTFFRYICELEKITKEKDHPFDPNKYVVSVSGYQDIAEAAWDVTRRVFGQKTSIRTEFREVIRNVRCEIAYSEFSQERFIIRLTVKCYYHLPSDFPKNWMANFWDKKTKALLKDRVDEAYAAIKKRDNKKNARKISPYSWDDYDTDFQTYIRNSRIEIIEPQMINMNPAFNNQEEKEEDSVQNKSVDPIITDATVLTLQLRKVLNGEPVNQYALKFKLPKSHQPYYVKGTADFIRDRIMTNNMAQLSEDLKLTHLITVERISEALHYCLWPEHYFNAARAGNVGLQVIFDELLEIFKDCMIFAKSYPHKLLKQIKSLQKYHNIFFPNNNAQTYPLIEPDKLKLDPESTLQENFEKFMENDTLLQHFEKLMEDLRKPLETINLVIKEKEKEKEKNKIAQESLAKQQRENKKVENAEHKKMTDKLMAGTVTETWSQPKVVSGIRGDKYVEKNLGFKPSLFQPVSSVQSKPKEVEKKAEKVIYSIKNGDKLLGEPFSLDDEEFLNKYHIHKITKIHGRQYYFFPYGLCEVDRIFINVVLNSKRFLKNNEKGQQGIKSLGNDSRLYGVKVCGLDSDRLVLSEKRIGKVSFLIPVTVLTHKRWEALEGEKTLGQSYQTKFNSFSIEEERMLPERRDDSDFDNGSGYTNQPVLPRQNAIGGP